MSDLIQSVTQGVIEQTKRYEKEVPVGGELGKDAFLQLLVTQMKYQDPMNPNSDTEYVAQLATFSQLEQLQNLGDIAARSQSLNLVGKNVIVKTDTDSGSIQTISGKVDFVTMKNGKVSMSINGKMYNSDQLYSVIDDIYILEKGLPRIDKESVLKYDPANPQDLSFEVFMGEDEYAASAIAVVINEKILDDKYVDIKDGKVNISKEALKELDEGTYPLTIAFNDPYGTIISDKITIEVKLIEPLIV